MGITNFPNGLSTRGSPVTGGNYITTGSVFFVDSNRGENDNHGKDPDHAFATIDHAIGHCTSGVGDYIFVMPGHSERLTAAAGIAVDKSGVSVIGLGRGNDRPNIILGTCSASIQITEHSFYMENVTLQPGSSAGGVLAPILIDSSDCHLQDIEMKMPIDTHAQCIEHIIASSSATGLKIIGYKAIETSDPSSTTETACVIHIGQEMGNVAGVEIAHCQIKAFTSESIVTTSSLVCNLRMHHNYLENATTSCIYHEDTAVDGIFYDNILVGATSGDEMFSFDTNSAVYLLNNYWVDEHGHTGTLSSSTDAGAS